MRWHSSNVPATDSVRTLRPQQASCFSWRGDTSPRGYSTTTSTHGRPTNAAATAPPVSPEVATRIVSRRGSARGMRSSVAARKRAPKSLNAAVGPWNSSSTDNGPAAPCTSTTGAGKLNASRVISPSRSAITSSAANGAIRPSASVGKSGVAASAATLSSGSNVGT